MKYFIEVLRTFHQRYYCNIMLIMQCRKLLVFQIIGKRIGVVLYKK